ncbi:hypothetical protein DPMN_038336 [Dreissena polymorpha]|uniref:Uncharacterized protein n=1 Tax=Dreissena polymorpha TaxID=45954 RepID=A0A9D4MF92_DREPO|nr:hypothetical protein DPMN_038336 [Dreissena polymorpha]
MWETGTVCVREEQDKQLVETMNMGDRYSVCERGAGQAAGGDHEHGRQVRQEEKSMREEQDKQLVESMNVGDRYSVCERGAGQAAGRDHECGRQVRCVRERSRTSSW